MDYQLLIRNIGFALIASAENATVMPTKLGPLAGETSSEEPAASPASEKKKPNPKRKTYTSETPPKSEAERALFKIQWGELGEKGLQDDYTAGKVDSLGVSLTTTDESNNESPSDEDFSFDEALEPKFGAQEVREALQKFAKENSKDDAYKILARFGAKKIADIKEKDFNDVMKAISK